MLVDVLARAGDALRAAGYQPDHEDRTLVFRAYFHGDARCDLYLHLEYVQLDEWPRPVPYLPLTPFDERRSERRERAVPCRVLGCHAQTWNVQALCGRHLNSDEPTAPRRLTALTTPPSVGAVSAAPTGGHPPAGRGQTAIA